MTCSEARVFPVVDLTEFPLYIGTGRGKFQTSLANALAHSYARN